MERLSPDGPGLKRAAALLKGSAVLAVPTDTVYGLVALASRPEAAARIYALKGRPAAKRLVLLVASAEIVSPLAEVDSRSRRWFDHWWPGPLTLVLAAREDGGSLAFRAPRHRWLLELLELAGEALVSTSANLSGERPAATAAEAELEGVDAVVDGGRLPASPPSTVVDLVGSRPRLVREGAVAWSRLEEWMALGSADMLGP